MVEGQGGEYRFCLTDRWVWVGSLYRCRSSRTFSFLHPDTADGVMSSSVKRRVSQDSSLGARVCFAS